jgi:purine-cytosine permease-like protein
MTKILQKRNKRKKKTWFLRRLGIFSIVTENVVPFATFLENVVPFATFLDKVLSVAAILAIYLFTFRKSLLPH